jgi:hypothetical protein
MKVDQHIYREAAETLVRAGGGTFGAWNDVTQRWSAEHQLPPELQAVFRNAAPKTEIWAGAGTLFGEDQIVRWNNDFPQALQRALLIVGSAPNGDHIAVDLRDGATGYISHEDAWHGDPRRYFIPVSESLGIYLRDINNEEAGLPDDYWAAKSRGAVGE